MITAKRFTFFASRTKRNRVLGLVGVHVRGRLIEEQEDRVERVPRASGDRDPDEARDCAALVTVRKDGTRPRASANCSEPRSGA